MVTVLYIDAHCLCSLLTFDHLSRYTTEHNITCCQFSSKYWVVSNLTKMYHYQVQSSFLIHFRVDVILDSSFFKQSVLCLVYVLSRRVNVVSLLWQSGLCHGPVFVALPFGCLTTWLTGKLVVL